MTHGDLLLLSHGSLGDEVDTDRLCADRRALGIDGGGRDTAGCARGELRVP